MSLFVSSCSRRQWARRRGRYRRGALGIMLTPTLMTASLVVVALGAFLAGRGI